MTKTGTFVGADAVRFERTLPGPIERVWAHLTEDDKRAKWFAGGAMAPVAGSPVTFVFRHRNLSSAEEAVPERWKDYKEGMTTDATVSVYEPPKRLVFDWGGDEVSFELEEVGSDVRLVLTHSKVANRKELIDVTGGWHNHLDVLEKVLRGEPLGLFWARAEQLHGEYEAKYLA